MKNKKGSTENFCESLCRPFDRLHASHSSKRKIYLSRQFTDNSQTARRSQICFSRIPPEISPDSLTKFSRFSHKSACASEKLMVY